MRLTHLLGLAAISLSVGCTDIDYELTEYGTSRRVGFGAATNIVATNDGSLENLGLAESAQSAPIYYSQPISRYSDVRFKFASESYPVDTGASIIGPIADGTSIDVIRISALVGIGRHFGRLGMFYRGGLEYTMSQLSRTGVSTDTHNGIMASTEFGLECIIAQKLAAYLSVGWSLGRTGLNSGAVEFDQVMDKSTVCMGLEFMF